MVVPVTAGTAWKKVEIKSSVWYKGRIPFMGKGENGLAFALDNGIYNLFLELEEDCLIRVGMIGTFSFPKGYYVYTGSAQRNMEKRIARHLSRHKKMHWHIDYLLKAARVLKVVRYEGLKEDECRINRVIGEHPHSQIIAKGFGSSDCRCKTHLYFFLSKECINTDWNA